MKNALFYLVLASLALMLVNVAFRPEATTSSGYQGANGDWSPSR